MLFGYAAIAIACSIACGTMNRKKLDNLRSEIARWRRKSAKYADLHALAVAAGLKRDKDKTNHPTYVSDELSTFPISIPMHAGREPSKGLKNGILNQIEEVADAWEELLDKQERSNGHENGNA